LASSARAFVVASSGDAIEGVSIDVVVVVVFFVFLLFLVLLGGA
jgi:hypothetical protein